MALLTPIVRLESISQDYLVNQTLLLNGHPPHDDITKCKWQVDASSCTGTEFEIEPGHHSKRRSSHTDLSDGT